MNSIVDNENSCFLRFQDRGQTNPDVVASICCCIFFFPRLGDTSMFVFGLFQSCQPLWQCREKLATKAQNRVYTQSAWIHQNRRLSRTRAGQQDERFLSNTGTHCARSPHFSKNVNAGILQSNKQADEIGENSALYSLRERDAE